MNQRAQLEHVIQYVMMDFAYASVCTSYTWGVVYSNIRGVCILHVVIYISKQMIELLKYCAHCGMSVEYK